MYHQLIIGGVSAFLVAVIGLAIIKFLRPRWLALTIALSIAVVAAFLVILNTLALANSYFGYSALEIITELLQIHFNDDFAPVMTPIPYE